jgi:CBS domain-containing protein
MNVSEMMSTNLCKIDAQATITEAAALMKERDVGWLPIMSGENVQGIVTDRDIVIRCVADGLDCESTPIREVMTREVFSCHSQDSMDCAAAVMEEKKVRRLLVTDAQDKPIGVLSVSDFTVRGHNRQLTGEVMEQVCGSASSSKW